MLSLSSQRTRDAHINPRPFYAGPAAQVSVPEAPIAKTSHAWPAGAGHRRHLRKHVRADRVGELIPVAVSSFGFRVSSLGI